MRNASSDPGSDARSKPEARFLGLVARNRGRIERLCHGWTRNTADREELRAEIWLQLWRSLPSFDGKSSEDTWLYRVALNTAMLHGRRERRRRSALEALGREPGAPSSAASAERALVEGESLRRLRRAVAALPPLDRAVVTLWLEELPYRRIAEITGLSESLVGVRLHRSKKTLAAQMVEEVCDGAR